MLKFDEWILGEPVSQPRPRARVVQARGKPAFAHIYTPNDANAWRELTSLAFAKHRKIGHPYLGAVRLVAAIYLPRPGCLMRKKDPDTAIACIRRGQGGDWDNLGKPICDALTDSHFWADDAQVFDGRVIKMYHGKISRPGARVVIQIFEEGERVIDPLLGDITPWGCQSLIDPNAANG